MKTRSLLVGIALFAAGCVTGWWFAHLPERATAPLPPTPVAAIEAPIEVESAPALANTVWLTVEYEGGSSLVPAVRLNASSGTPGLLIAALYNVYPATAIYYQTTDGEQKFPTVVAASDIHQLVALQDSHEGGFDVSQEDGSLFVGKSVRLDLPNQTLPGEIDSALQTAPSGRQYFAVSFSRAEGRKGGPLSAANGDDLIGFVTAARSPQSGWMDLSGDRYGAIDASTLRDFLRTERFDTPKSARDFSAHFSTTPGGLRFSVAQLAERQQWAGVYRSLEQLLSAGTDNADITQQALTLSAYYHGHQLVEASQSSQALALISDMRVRFPQEQPWCLIESRANAQLERWERAFAGAYECALDPLGVQPRDNELLYSPFREALSGISSAGNLVDFAHAAAVQFANDSGASRQRQFEVLLDALALGEDANVYRRLGDLEYDARNYAVAQRYYRNAIRLDPSIEASLGNRLRNSSQRADSAPASEIPFEKRGGGLVVNARLNDSPQTFRLLVDTGATYTALSGGTLLRLGLGNIFNQSADVIELEAAGGTIYARRFTLGSMQIGTARVTQMPVVILENLEGFDGLVGLSFLRHFDVSIDQEAGTLILVPR